MKAISIGLVLILTCGIAFADPALRRIFQSSPREEISICRHAAKLVDRGSNENIDFATDCPAADQVTLQTLLSEVREPLQNRLAQEQKDIEVLTGVVDGLKREIQDLQARTSSIASKEGSKK